MSSGAPVLDPRQVVDYVRMLKTRSTARDLRHRDITAIRDGDYDSVAPGLFPPEFPRAMVANLIDTAARDVSEMMAPLPGLNCASVSMTSDRAKRFAEKRGRIANGYVQRSRLAQARFAGCDRYVTYGFMAYIVEPDFQMQSPVIRMSCVPSSYYTLDWFGRCKQFAEVYFVSSDVLRMLYPESGAAISAAVGKDQWGADRKMDLEVIRYYNDDFYALVLVESKAVLAQAKNPLGRCPVTVVERPSVTAQVHGQFDDVVWVQIVRAMIQNYTLSALEQSVNAPIVVPTGTTGVELGPLSTLETDNPQGVGRLNLQIPPGLFPEQQILGQEQLTGSRYPQGRTGNIDASIVTGQGVQALMGTFDTQIQTFQKLDTVALDEAMSIAFEMDEKIWSGVTKTVRVKDAGSPFEVVYDPAKDIAGDYSIDVSYGAIAGLDPNRGLVFILQTLAAQLISKDTARRYLPVDLNPTSEDQKIDIEAMRDSLTAAMATLPQAIPQLAAQGMDVRALVLELSQVMDLRQKGRSIDEAVREVFAPKQNPQDQAAAAAAPQAPGAAGAPTTPGQQLMQSLAGLTAGGQANLQANVQRTQPI